MVLWLYMSNFQSTKLIELGSCAFRQPNAVDNRLDAGTNSERCSFVHGYQLKAKFWFSCKDLDDKNWVVDFGGLKSLKTILQKHFDHTLCIDKQDPLLPLFKQLHEAGGCDLRVMEHGVGIERTAEFCFKIADKLIREQTNSRCWVDKVEVFEHELNSAVYSVQSINNVSFKEYSQTTVLPEPSDTALNVSSQATLTRSNNSTPAPVGSIVTQGKGNWFSGTTWGE